MQQLQLFSTHILIHGATIWSQLLVQGALEVPLDEKADTSSGLVRQPSLPPVRVPLVFDIRVPRSEPLDPPPSSAVISCSFPLHTTDFVGSYRGIQSFSPVLPQKDANDTCCLPYFRLLITYLAVTKTKHACFQNDVTRDSGIMLQSSVHRIRLEP